MSNSKVVNALCFLLVLIFSNLAAAATGNFKLRATISATQMPQRNVNVLFDGVDVADTPVQMRMWLVPYILMVYAEIFLAQRSHRLMLKAWKLL